MTVNPCLGRPGHRVYPETRTRRPDARPPPRTAKRETLPDLPQRRSKIPLKDRALLPKEGASRDASRQHGDCMPVFRIGEKLCYFAHVPKCGGSSVDIYLEERFGTLGFHDSEFTGHEKAERWSKTSPQHIDWASLQHLLPEAMLDAVFVVVRHPVARIVSAYHFQVEVERTVPCTITFSSWLKHQLKHQLERRETDPFAVDNHVRPQIDFIPENCTVFHLEHGLDAIVPYLDGLAGASSGPRVIRHWNKRTSKDRKGPAVEQTLEAADLALIREIYARDFERFGYDPERPEPAAPKPALPADYIAARDAELARTSRLLHRTTTRIRRGIARRLG